MSKLKDLGLEILKELSNIPEQTLQVRAAIAKTILMNNALDQVPEQKEKSFIQKITKTSKPKSKTTRKKKK